MARIPDRESLGALGLPRPSWRRHHSTGSPPARRIALVCTRDCALGKAQRRRIRGLCAVLPIRM